MMTEATPSATPKGAERWARLVREHGMCKAVTCDAVVAVCAQLDALERRDHHLAPLMEALEVLLKGQNIFVVAHQERARKVLNAAQEATR